MHQQVETASVYTKVGDGMSVARARYLETAYDVIRAELLHEAPARDTVALAFSFPITGGRAVKKLRLGECHYLKPEDLDQSTVQNPPAYEKHLLAIHPIVWAKGDLEVLATLAHEMAHASLPFKVGHRAPFKRLAYRMGLVGPATATFAGDPFKAWVDGARAKLPTYPGGVSLDLFKRKKQASRLRLWICACVPKPVKVRVASDEFTARCNECLEDFTMVEPEEKDDSEKGED